MVVTAIDVEIKAGYKQTEVGVIPEDWETSSWGKLATLEYGKSLRGYENTHGPYPVYGTNGPIGRHTTMLCKHPGVIVGRKGAYRGIHFSNEPFYVIDTAYYLEAKEDIDQKWAYYELLTHNINHIDSGSAIPSTSRETFYSLSVIVPPLSEQRAIANALSDVDALITSLDKLIAKKRDIKQATMQQLLTGKMRLPGFSGEWEVKKLGDVVETILGGGTPSRSNSEYWGGNVPWVTVKDFATFNPHSTQECITEFGLQNSSSNLIRKGTIIISTRMAIGKAVIYEVNVSINQDLKALSLKKDVNTLFTFYWFEMNAKNIEQLGSGSTVKCISLSDLKNVRAFPIPPTTSTERIWQSKVS